MKKIEPIHLGEILLEEFMKSLNISLSFCAVSG